MMYELPVNVKVNGVSYEIRSDYRAILDIITALSDPELNEQERAIVALDIFYPDFPNMPYSDYGEALKQCMQFVSGGENPGNGSRVQKLMDWEQDFPLIVAPVNRVLGIETRSAEYLHWWTFLSAYQEIGDCTFAQVVSIRKKKRSGKKLDKAEQDYYKANRALVDFRRKYTDEENGFISKWV